MVLTGGPSRLLLAPALRRARLECRCQKDLQSVAWPRTAAAVPPQILRQGSMPNSAFHSSAAQRSASGSSSSSQVVEQVAATSSGSTANSGYLDWLSSSFDPLIPYVHQLPELLHLPTDTPHAYAWSIVLATFLLRSTVTLPAQIWASRRTGRMRDEVAPRWNFLRGKEGLPKLMMAKKRREGASFEEYKKDLEVELKAQLKNLLRKHRCSPIPTLVVPLVLSVPLFLATSFTLRQGLLPPSPLLTETIPWWSSPNDSLARSFEASAQMLRDRGMDPAALQMLSKPAGPSLGERDSTMMSPVGLGLLLYLNVELNAWARRANTAALRVSSSSSSESTSSPAEQDHPSPSTNGNAEIAPATPANESSEGAATSSKESLPSRIVSTGLKGLSILFVVVASQAPTGLVIYWLSNAVYTLGFTSVSAWLERRRVRRESSSPEAPPAVPEAMRFLTQGSSSSSSSNQTATPSSPAVRQAAASVRKQAKKPTFSYGGGEVGRGGKK